MEFSRAYKIWLIVNKNPGTKLAHVAEMMKSKANSISGDISAMTAKGNLSTAGRKGDYSYHAVESNPPKKYGRGVYTLAIDIPDRFEWLERTPDNDVFNECRKNSGNYYITKLIQESRA